MSDEPIFEDTPFGRLEIDPKKGTTKMVFPDGVDTRLSIQIRQKYRPQN